MIPDKITAVSKAVSDNSSPATAPLTASITTIAAGTGTLGLSGAKDDSSVGARKVDTRAINTLLQKELDEILALNKKNLKKKGYVKIAKVALAMESFLINSFMGRAKKADVVFAQYAIDKFDEL